jgi:Nif-specific regulatory protein
MVGVVARRFSEETSLGSTLTFPFRSHVAVRSSRRGPHTRVADDAPDLVGRSAAHHSLLRELERFASFEVPVLLTGETGTGKSHAARLLHTRSRRSSRSFLEINCNTLPDGLIESELFGALAGSHSTALRASAGKVAAASGGTLFLDEIGDLPLPAQGKLLQLLESGVYYPLGASQPCRADVRLVAATNLDLAAAVHERRFREDLYYRLCVAVIQVPSLRSRRSDIVPLAEHFRAWACERHGLPDVPLSPNLLAAVEKREWPGNARQLAHRVEVACIRAALEGATTVEARHMFFDPEDVEQEGSDRTESVNPPEGGLREATRQFQSRLIRQALEAEGGRVAAAARRLGVSRSHFYMLVRELRLDVPQKSGSPLEDEVLSAGEAD